MPAYLPPHLGVSQGAAIREAWASATAGETIVRTLEFHHPAFSAPARVACSLRDLTATLEAGAPVDAGLPVTFVGLPFRFSLPDQTDSGAPPAVTLEIDNASLYIARLLEQARGREQLLVMHRDYLRSDTTAPHVLPVLRTWMQLVRLKPDIATGTLAVTFLTNLRFPVNLFTRERFPALAAAQ